MGLIATLISHPRDRALDTESVGIAVREFSATHVEWLAQSVACDLILFDETNCEEKYASLREKFINRPIDIVLHESSTRRKKILIADMDSTIINQECIDELADEAGLGADVRAITQRAMNGELGFEDSLYKRVGLLKDISNDMIVRTIKERITVRSGAYELIRTMRAHGAWTALVSGGFDVFTAPIAKKVGFNENRANHLFMQNNKLTGKLKLPLLGPEEKATILSEIALEHNFLPNQALAVGDGANDIPMLKKAGLGVAFHAKPFVTAQTKIRIDYGDLTALLFLQGYKQTEFIS